MIILFFRIPAIIDPAVQDPVNAGPDGKETKPLFTFGIIADAQYADCNPAGERYYRLSLKKLNEALNSFRKDSVNFIINLGDIIDRDYESYKPVLNEINSSGIRTYHITGNHDYSVDPRFLRRLPVFTDSRDGYFSIKQGNFRLLFLNGNEMSTYASPDKATISQADDYIEKLKKEGEINAIDWNGGIGKTQFEWMTTQLDSAALASEKVIFLCHFPISPENIHNLLNYKDILPLLSKYNNIVAWLSGHNHDGNYHDLNNIHCITFKGMVETKDSNSYAIVEVYNDRIIVRGFGREDSRILFF